MQFSAIFSILLLSLASSVAVADGRDGGGGDRCRGHECDDRGRDDRDRRCDDRGGCDDHDRRCDDRGRCDDRDDHDRDDHDRGDRDHRDCDGRDCDDHNRRCPPGHEDECKVKTREVCFNISCTFKNHNGRPFEQCTAASTFTKKVTLDGGEVVDDSNSSNNPQLEVKCDHHDFGMTGARRFTTLLGTRIQSLAGPFPALTLPRGALHSGDDHHAGEHSSRATLEVPTDQGFERLQGQCFIWTGAP